MRAPVLAALALIMATSAAARETAVFLASGAGARALAMGGAYTAVADDLTAAVWNPAGLAGMPARELAFTHEDRPGRDRFEFAGFAAPTKIGTFAVSGRHLSQGGLDGRDSLGRPTGGFSASDTAVELAYGAAPPKGPRLGAAVRYIESRIADVSARGYSVDLGANHRLAVLGPGVARLGLAIRNLGPKMTFLDEPSPLPLTVAAGAAYALPQGLTVALDYRSRPHASSSEGSLGAEWTRALSKDLAGSLRAGADSSRRDLGGLAVLSLGAGLRLGGVDVAFAWLPGGMLGDSFLYSLGTRF